MYKSTIIAFMSFICIVIGIGTAFTASFIPNDKILGLNKSTVRVANRCSGFIPKEGIVITAAHCVHSQERISITFHDNKTRGFIVKYVGIRNTAEDFAILSGNTESYAYTPLKKELPKRFELLWHFGYNHSDVQYKTPSAYITDLVGDSGREYYIAGRIIPGDSGGPLFTYDFSYSVGIAYAAFYPANVGLAVFVPAALILRKLKELNL